MSASVSTIKAAANTIPKKNSIAAIRGGTKMPNLHRPPSTTRIVKAEAQIAAISAAHCGKGRPP